MKITVRIEDDVAIIACAGSIEFADARRFAGRFRALLDEGRRLFVFDLDQLSYIESTMIAEVISSLKRARERSGEIAIVSSPRGKVREILRITALDRAIGIFDELPAALEAMRGRPGG